MQEHSCDVLVIGGGATGGGRLSSSLKKILLDY
jgi:glycerol-3-phosphate dehydrogenase